MLHLRLLETNSVPWDRLKLYQDRVVFQTREWLDFVAETQSGQPVVAEVRDGQAVVGYFSGIVVQKLGVRMLGSSFPGWTTPYMGFNLDVGVSRRDALAALERWAFGDMKCLHFEVSDRHFGEEDAADLGFEHSAYETYITDLRPSEADLFAAMEGACRRCIRKAEKGGVIIEEVTDASGFAEEFHAQLKDVFAKQQKIPSYRVDRLRSLVRHLHPTGNLLLLRARRPDGLCIATGIYPGMNQVAEFWGNASWREHQNWRPNEALHWHALRYWKARGATVFDWGGGGTYKEKYGVQPFRVPWFFKSKYKFLSTMRNEMRTLYYRGQKLVGRLKAKMGDETKAAAAGVASESEG